MTHAGLDQRTPARPQPTGWQRVTARKSPQVVWVPLKLQAVVELACEQKEQLQGRSANSGKAVRARMRERPARRTSLEKFIGSSFVVSL
jgi:hypothetical protein